MNKIKTEYKQNAPLITCEGIDGSGKSTICKMLSKHLTDQNIQTILTKEPGGTPFGLQLRNILQHSTEPISPIAEFLLFAADRAHHLASIVKPALQKGTWVISDRMHDSSVAYQGYGRSLDLNIINQTNKIALQGIEPTITLYLKIDPEKAHMRINQRNEEKTRFEQEKKDFWLRVIGGFETIFATRSNVIVLDATKTPEEIMTELLTHQLWKNLIDHYAA
jgi:dTMP kinase